MDAPDFELPTMPADASDALQLDPSDSLSGFEMALPDSKPKSTVESLPQYVSKPPKKPTPQDNDSVLAALLGKPIVAQASAPESTGDETTKVPVSILAAVLGKEIVAPAKPVQTLKPTIETPSVIEPIIVETVPPLAVELAPPMLRLVGDFSDFLDPEPEIDTSSFAQSVESEIPDEATEDFGPDSYPIGIPFTPSESHADDEIVEDPEEAVELPQEPVETVIPIPVVMPPKPARAIEPRREVKPLIVAPKPVVKDEPLEAAFAIEAPSLSPQVPSPKRQDPLAPTGAWWTLPLMFAGIAIVACAVLVPAADENRRATYELAKIDRDVTYFQKQSDVNKDFLERVSNDPTLAERLALRQLHMTRADTHLMPLPGKADPFNRSPFALVSVDPPPALEPYRPVGGLLGDWFLDLRRQIYFAGFGLLLAAAGVIFGGGEPIAVIEEE